MKISVIIPTYNEEKVIVDCLHSLLDQKYQDFEVIVVDDGSTDLTLNKVREIDSNKIIILNKNHDGAGAARNYGVKKSTGDILVFVDADMIFDNIFLKKLTEPIVKGIAVGTFSKEEYLLNKNNVWAVCWNLNRDLPKDRMHRRDYADEQRVFRAIFKSVFLKSGGFNEKAGYVDDWSISEKLGIKAVLAPGAIFYHRNPDNLFEIYTQSSWMAKRKYKMGLIGVLFALLRVSFPISILVGAFKALKFKIPQFLIFKIFSDLGQFIGIIEFNLIGKVSK